ncbi:hypothetical protein PsorP6_004577 [Peronosclerospora sorghi]|uniref:Uncharacterized protein n=1 Tax=Peronosclerospora sorghi TaxID=230839 RepID=A0ACC0VID9_9STRA|nr:hypothetical protein PsorP6_004577 [Peronosclerospora sorghi]
MVKLHLACAATVLSIATVSTHGFDIGVTSSPAQDSALDAKAKSIVDNFSLEQVAGQMTQIEIEAVLNDDYSLNETWPPLNNQYGWNASEFRAIVQRIQEITMEENGGHPMIYGLDSVHGANYVDGAVMFPQQINSAASFDPDMVYKVGQITARDTQAAGIPWIFGPILEVSQNKLWARTFETFGEDPYLVSVMGDAIVRGLQSLNQTAACIKHFIGYSKTPTGHDRDNVIMADFDLLNYFMPQFKAAMKAGALTMMENYISLNGNPVIANRRILKDLLRSDLGFSGMLVSDWGEIYNLVDWHRIVDNYEDAVALSLKETSIDMSMVPYDEMFINYTLNMVQRRPEYEARIRESAMRIVKTKLKLGLYDKPIPGKEYISMVGNNESVSVALDVARESIVLLKNAHNTIYLTSAEKIC